MWFIRTRAVLAAHELLHGSLASQHLIARCAEVDNVTGLSMLQLAQQELQQHSSPAAVDIAALLQADKRFSQAFMRDKAARKLEQSGLSYAAAAIELAFIYRQTHKCC